MNFDEWKQKMDCSPKVEEYKMFDNEEDNEWFMSSMRKAFNDGYKEGQKGDEE